MALTKDQGRGEALVTTMNAILPREVSVVVGCLSPQFGKVSCLRSGQPVLVVNNMRKTQETTKRLVHKTLVPNSF